jgi:6,7-dimethyl-8-ribityllumazine synthase
LRNARLGEWLTLRVFSHHADQSTVSLSAPSSRAVATTGLRLGIVAARFNEALVDGLLARVVEALGGAGVRPKQVAVVRVPGSHEVPWAVQRLAAGGKFDCVIALGVLIAGVSQALQHVAITTGVPAINGVLVVNSPAQARARCVGRINRGAEFAAAAVAMAALRRELSR